MFHFRQFIDFHLLGRHRLENVDLLPLGSSLSDAIRRYGEPIETGPSDDAPEITQHVFSASPYHEAVVFELDAKIQSITYWSAKGDPGRDLSFMLHGYKDDSQWHVMEKGYWYQRDDGKLRLWCSSIPAIGVAYVDYLEAKSELKTAHRISGLAALEDVAWAPDDAIQELQRRCVETQAQDTGLRDLAGRSDRFAVSPDARHVFVVRNHHAFGAADGFSEVNEPPVPGVDSSTEVINYYFLWSEDGSSWGKVVLPRDAHVDRIQFEGNQCHLQIRQTTTGRTLTFRGPPAFVPGLGHFALEAFNDQKLWRELEEEGKNLVTDGGGFFEVAGGS